MGDKCNCYRFSPRDSLSGAVAQIADYLSKHPGWNETELRAFVDGLISSAGVETFNGRSGNVTLNKDDVNNLLIANCYFAEADETIESIDVLALYKLGIRIVFTQYSSEVGGYTLAYGIEYYPTTDTAKAYLFSSGSGGVGAVVSVNGKTGTVVLKASDILMNNGDSVEDAVSNAKAIANAAYSPNNPPSYPVTSVNGKTGTVTGLYDENNPPPYPVNSVNSKTGSVLLKVVDVSNGNSTDENAYMFIDESDDYPDVIASDSNKLDGKTLAEIMLTIYPVGAVYISVNSTSPASLFGGTWTQLTDRFLLGAGNTYGVGSVGGESIHILTRDEIPNYKIGALATIVPPLHGNWSNDGISASGLGETSETKPGIADNNDNKITSGIQYGYDIYSYGGGSAHNNMPPYLAVYMWKRVS